MLYAKPDTIHSAPRPVVPESLQLDIFKLVHDDLGHVGYNRIHDQLHEKLYLFNISRNPKSFLWHCHEYRIRQPPRDLSYGSLQLVASPPSLFHTMTIDLILALPIKCPNQCGSAMTITYKFSKVITIFPDKIRGMQKKWG